MNENIGKFIKKLRKEKKLSQEKLADLIPTDRSNISRWENGNTLIPINQMERICEIFQIQISELICGERINDNNKIENNKKVINLIENENRKYKRIKTSLILSFVSLVVVTILFLVYYFFQTYNTQNIYKIYSNSNDYKINDGLLVLTREEVYFKLGTINNQDMAFELYKKDKLIYSGDSDDLLVDYYGYDQYFDTKNIKDELNDYYIVVNNKILKIKFKKIYNNKNFLLETSNEISIDKTAAGEIYIPKIIKKEFDCNKEICKHKENGNEYIYDISTKDFTIISNNLYAIDNFELKTFEVNIDNKSYSVYNGKNNYKNKEQELVEKLYKEYYIKIEEKYWK